MDLSDLVELRELAEDCVLGDRGTHDSVVSDLLLPLKGEAFGRDVYELP